MPIHRADGSVVPPGAPLPPVTTASATYVVKEVLIPGPMGPIGPPGVDGATGPTGATGAGVVGGGTLWPSQTIVGPTTTSIGTGTTTITYLSDATLGLVTLNLTPPSGVSGQDRVVVVRSIGGRTRLVATGGATIDGVSNTTLYKGDTKVLVYDYATLTWRSTTGDAATILGEDTYYISLGGDDTNAGTAEIAPLATWKEFLRRTRGKLLRPTTVYFLDSPTGSDPVVGTFEISWNPNDFVYRPSLTLLGKPAVLDSGSVTAIAAQSTTVPASITSPGMAWSSYIGKRIYTTPSNYTSWIIEDMGSDVARIGQLADNTEVISGAPTSTTSVDILDDIVINGFDVRVTSIGHGITGGYGYRSPVLVRGLWLYLDTGIQDLTATFIDCHLDTGVYGPITNCHLKLHACWITILFTFPSSTAAMTACILAGDAIFDDGSSSISQSVLENAPVDVKNLAALTVANCWMTGTSVVRATRGGFAAISALGGSTSVVPVQVLTGGSVLIDQGEVINVVGPAGAQFSVDAGALIANGGPLPDGTTFIPTAPPSTVAVLDAIPFNGSVFNASTGSRLRKSSSIGNEGAYAAWDVTLDSTSATIDPYNRWINLLATSPGVFVFDIPTGLAIGQLHTFMDLSGVAETVVFRLSATDLIDGAATFDLTENYQAVTIRWDGSTWKLISDTAIGPTTAFAAVSDLDGTHDNGVAATAARSDHKHIVEAIQAVAISGTAPTTGQTLLATSVTTADWEVDLSKRVYIPFVAGAQDGDAAASSIFQRGGSAVIDMSVFPTTRGGLTRNVKLECVLETSASAADVEAKLLDFTHGLVDITGSLVDTTGSPDPTIPYPVSSVLLTVGASSGDIRNDAVTTYFFVYRRINGSSGDRAIPTMARLLVEYV